MTPAPPSRITAVRPLWAVEGGRVTIIGDGFGLEPRPPRSDRRRAGAAVALASRQSLTVIVPAGLDGGHTAVRVDSAPGETAYVEIGAPLATGLHQVDNPAFDRRRQPVRDLQRVARPADAGVDLRRAAATAAREPFVVDLPNPTSMAFDREGRLHVSSRFDGSVHRVEPDGRYRPLPPTSASRAASPSIATATSSSAIDRDPSSAFATGEAKILATLPPSVAAFHLAFGPDG